MSRESVKNGKSVPFLVVVFLVLGLFSPMRSDVALGLTSFVNAAFADDDDEDEEDDDDDEDEDEDEEDDEEKAETRTVYVTRYETRTASRVVTVLPEEYKIDTDGDSLVDGIDPNPNIHQKEFFTDTDGDAIPDAFDRYHDDDDFVYFDGGNDLNENGILDSYEGIQGS